MSELTKDQIDALRNADSVVFRVYRGRSTIEATIRTDNDPTTDRPRILSAKQQRIFPMNDAYERKCEIEVPGFVSDYSLASLKEYKDAAAFYMVHTSKFSMTWQSIVSILKGGDILSLHFVGNKYTNDYVRDKGLNGDAVEMGISRKGKAFTFVVGTSICPDNSARMVKPLGY